MPASEQQSGEGEHSEDRGSSTAMLETVYVLIGYAFIFIVPPVASVSFFYRPLHSEENVLMFLMAFVMVFMISAMIGLGFIEKARIVKNGGLIK